jgi:hypothetical protein
MVWTRVASVCDAWVEAAKTSRFVDQAAIEELPKQFTYFEFDDSYNVSWWRVSQSDTPPKFNLAGGPCVGDRFIKCVHTHFADRQYGYFNQVIIQMLNACGRYQDLCLIERIINKKWVIFGDVTLTNETPDVVHERNAGGPPRLGNVLVFEGATDWLYLLRVIAT